MELHPLPLDVLLLRAFEELKRHEAVFDLPRSKFWQPPADLDLSCVFRGERVSTPAGPAAGPQSQMAQNVVLAWLAGARVIELKTVQVDDRLAIPRPCIDARTIGFNVEWSQELRVEESLQEYVGAWMMIRILAESGVLELPAGSQDLVFDMSVGYDLAGIRTRKVSDFVGSMLDAGPTIERLRGCLQGPLARYRDLDFSPRVAAGITLSTFHGCPADEIESICRYLLEELGTHVVIKLNPTLLGFERVEEILRGELGYEHLRLDRSAFEHDLKWEECQGIVERLEGAAQARGLTLGVKFSNTLVVENHSKDFFPAEKQMYMSGAPLHALAIALATQFRERFGDRFGISFSAGVEQRNFSAATACDLVPITSCTDLLRAGGYGRMTGYLDRLAKDMRQLGVRSRGDYILLKRGQGAELAVSVLGEELGAALQGYLAAGQGLDVRAWLSERGREDDYARLVAAAGAANLSAYAAEVRQDPQYRWEKNKKAPRKIGSSLVLFDCISCDKCVPVCPNDANFALEVAPVDQESEEVHVGEAGEVTVQAAAPYRVERTHQLANFADWCNDCGNCDVFCPEDGGPYVVKPHFFAGEASYRESGDRDGFYLEAVLPAGVRMRGRVDGHEYTLVSSPGSPDRFEDDRVASELDPESGKVVSARAFFAAQPGDVLPTWPYLAMRALLGGLRQAGATTAVGAILAAQSGEW